VPVTLARGPRKVGGASGTATSFCQSLASSPSDDSRIITMKTATIASDTMPTRSLFSRFQAVTQTPRERVAPGT
jgi:hypothetical protein